MAIFNKKTKPINLQHNGEIDDLLASNKPILIDFFQFGCRPCQIMDGIINELADDFGEEAVVVKANLAHVPDLFERYKVKSTPTFLVLNWRDGANSATQRFRASGLVKKDVLTGALKSGLPKN